MDALIAWAAQIAAAMTQAALGTLIEHGPQLIALYRQLRQSTLSDAASPPPATTQAVYEEIANARHPAD